MAFINEAISEKEDKEYFMSLGLTSIIDDELEPYRWTIDRERNIFLYGRGGGSFEIPIGYGLYIGGTSIEMEVTEYTEGSRLKDNLKVWYYIKMIEIPESLLQQGYKTEELISIIEEAFYATGYHDVDRSKILELTVRTDVAEIIIC